MSDNMSHGGAINHNCKLCQQKKNKKSLSPSASFSLQTNREDNLLKKKKKAQIPSTA
jgi:hypothetical protein